ncbi:MAG: hypothetical protein ACOX3I_00715 [Limnochordia bacterium]
MSKELTGYLESQLKALKLKGVLGPLPRDNPEGSSKQPFLHRVPLPAFGRGDKEEK